MQYLYNSTEIRNKINYVFSGENEKCAIVAFVGNGVCEILSGYTDNLTVICWPKAGATSPDGVRWLIDSGVKVYFCDNLHHKIFWSKENGVIIGSSNLSSRALVGGSQHESAIYQAGKSFDVNRILSQLVKREVTEDELYELDVSGEAIRRSRNSLPDERIHASDVTFSDAINTTFPRKWKIVTWTNDWSEENKQIIKDEVESEFGVTHHINSNELYCKKFKVGDYVIQIKTDDNGCIKNLSGRWLVVDHVIWKKSLHAIVQVKNSIDLSPPFVIDKTFRRALREAINSTDDWGDVHDNGGNPTQEFILRLKRAYENAAG